MSQKTSNIVKIDKSIKVDSFRLGSCRKNRKPLMEKKRRARINDSLEALKDILLKNTVAITKGTRPTKLEKADILEMTVRYLQTLHKCDTIQNGKSSDCCVSSTTSLLDQYKSKSISTAELSKNFPFRLRKTLNDVNETNKENLSHTHIVNNRFRPSESSAFHVIKSKNKEVLNAKTSNYESTNPWRPW